MRRTFSHRVETFPLVAPFVLARGSLTVSTDVLVTITEGAFRGRGECVPYPRYGETPDSVAAQIEQVRPAIEAGLDRAGLQDAMTPGAARNAVDCALWDLEAKRLGLRAAELAGLHRLG